MKVIYVTRVLFIYLMFYSLLSFAAEAQNSEHRYQFGDGLNWQTDDEMFTVKLNTRFQLRYSTPDDSQPITIDDYFTEGETEAEVNRARLKAKGQAFRPWLNYSLEYQLNDGFVLDYQIKVEKFDWLSFKVGQWKLEYSRERSISSGGQQMLDRSILNRHFTIDRHRAVSLYGTFNQGTLAEWQYWLALGTGTGRGGDRVSGQHLYSGRVQWNYLGQSLDFIASDVDTSPKPKGSLAYAWARYESEFTRFSSSGGGSLHGFGTGVSGQYKVSQYTLNTAFLYAGFSGHAEFHRKEIRDRTDVNQTRTLQGHFVQGGYFLHQTYRWWPKELEVAVRFSDYQPDTDLPFRHKERSLALNWFIAGHDNKITLDATEFYFQHGSIDTQDKWHYRMQWEVTF